MKKLAFDAGVELGYATAQEFEKAGVSFAGVGNLFGRGVRAVKGLAGGAASAAKRGWSAWDRFATQKIAPIGMASPAERAAGLKRSLTGGIQSVQSARASMPKRIPPNEAAARIAKEQAAAATKAKADAAAKVKADAAAKAKIDTATKAKTDATVGAPTAGAPAAGAPAAEVPETYTQAFMKDPAKYVGMGYAGLLGTKLLSGD